MVLTHDQLFCYFGPVEVYHSRITRQRKAHLMTRGEREVGRESWGGTEGEMERERKRDRGRRLWDYCPLQGNIPSNLKTFHYVPLPLTPPWELNLYYIHLWGTLEDRVYENAGQIHESING